MTEKTLLEGHNTHIYFGGDIELEDFNTTTPNKNRISNFVEANRLQKIVNKKKMEKELKMKYTNYSLEELREMRLVSNTNGRPTDFLTDEKWQKEFTLRKMFITPHDKYYKKLTGKYSKESGSWNKETKGEYQGTTNWQQYCSFINSVLDTIRTGQVDYCYYIYQILDLAKFHYNDLRTKYCDGYWEIWLER